MRRDGTEVGSQRNPIVYRGWNVMWTGWKTEKFIAGTVGLIIPENPCVVCNEPIADGDAFFMEFNASMYWHWTCKHPDNRPGYLYSQWYSKPIDRTEYLRGMFLYTNCARMPVNQIPGGLIAHGSAFEIPEDFVQTTENDNEEIREFARSQGLGRIFHLIDQYADAALQT